MIQRPAHLRQRQVRGRAFSTTASLVRTTGAYDANGEYAETEAAPVSITCSTVPVTAGDPRARLLTEGGVQLDAARIFWLSESVQPVTDDAAGDILVYDGERYRVKETQPWGPFWEVLGLRQEGQ